MAVQLGSAYGKIEIDASSVQRSVQSAVASINGMKSAGDSLSKASASLGSSLDSVARDAKQVGESLKPVAIALAGVSAASGALITKSTLTAARTEELGFVLQAVAKNARDAAFANGDLAKSEQYTEENTLKTVDAVKKKGITTQVSLGLTAQFARYQLDLAKATDLARVSQDAAVLSMENSSENLDGLMYGIITYNQRILRTHGINVDLSKAFDQMAASIGKTADELTEAEKVDATLNAVLGEGKRIAGAYEAAMDSAGKRLRSLDRYWQEAQNNLGKAFLPAMGQLVDTTTNLLKAFNELSPAQQQMAAEGLAITAAVTGAAGGFILLAPKILQTASAMVQFVALGKEVAFGLQLVKAGFSEAEVASTGFAGSMAVALPVVAALTATIIAASMAYKLNQEIQKDTAAVSDAMTKHLREQAEAGKSVADVMAEYTATQARVNQAYEAAPIYLKPFIDQQKLLSSGLDGYSKVLAESSLGQSQYETELRRAAAAAGLNIDAQGNLIRVTYNGRVAITEVIQANIVMSETERQVAKAIKESASEVSEFRYVQQQAGTAIAKTAEQMKKEAEEADKLRDTNARVVDSVLDVAKSFADSNAKLVDRAELQDKLNKLNAEVVKQGPAHIETILKTKMSEEDLQAAITKRLAVEEDIVKIHKKKGETDREYAARLDGLKAQYADLGVKISQATGATGAHTAVVGGATKAQQEERQSILDKIAAIDEEIKKELARQAVESLTPEMFGTGAEAAAKYEAAKRGLMLATGMVTKEALAEQDAIRLLTGALANGMITPEQYAAALGNVKRAAVDGEVSLHELTDSLGKTGVTSQLVTELNSLPGAVSPAIKSVTSQFVTELNSIPGVVSPAAKGIASQFVTELNSIPRSIPTSLSRARDEAIAAGHDIANGLTQGVSSNAAALSDALRGAADQGIIDLRAKLQMRSPSLVFAGLGQNMMQGLAMGVTGGAAMLSSALQMAVDAAALSVAGMSPFIQTLQNIAFTADLLTMSLGNMSAMMRDTVMAALLALNTTMAGEGGTISDLQVIQTLAAESMKTIGTPLSNAFILTANSISYAAQMANALADTMREIRSMNGMVVRMTFIKHEITYHEDRYGNPNAASSPPAFAYGGSTGAGGLAVLHPNEYVLTEAMRRGLRPIPPEALAPGAKANLAPAGQITNDYASKNAPQIRIYGGLALYGVQDTRSLLAELQGMA